MIVAAGTVTTSRIPSSNRWTIAVTWLAFGGIASLYFIGVAASAVISFGPAMSFASAVSLVSISDRLDISWALHGSVLALCITALLVHTFSHSRRIRFALPLLCMLAPLFVTAGDLKGIAQWLVAMPAAPWFTITALAGRQDGEFYADGLLVFTAIGWWMILWCVLLFRELLSGNNLPSNAATTTLSGGR